MAEITQQQLDVENSSFWDELCGSAQAKGLGVVDSGVESLRKFDDWFMSYYPYVGRHLQFERLKGRKVLEIGLGYGTISQKIAEAGAQYSGLDIAKNPVGMVNHRLRQNNLPGAAVQGNMLNCPFGDGEFDFVVAIGCFHHTGNLQRCLDESWRVLKAGGSAMVMVYNSYSYRRWQQSFRDTFQYFAWDKFGIGGGPAIASDRERATYDGNLKGDVAPEIAFTSAGQIRQMAKNWSSVRVRRENVAVYEWVLKNQSRDSACKWFGPVFGLDLYCSLKK